ncbi:homoserine kinase [Dethiosulfovibrio peptidovorans DSM 11002]|uniref:Homoserine kinase n=1 Tax=Dethiosulfovibrio peptidovorans DSM 11002 TaxID=469381 RepID=D2Z4R4_9BACT|nr:homoserine kinase [Dethiosulfovibrio peptidovorans]EFC92408.1 homoserine kinase [Dethiosulfovibrio peptidovorans DSM 11002]
MISVRVPATSANMGSGYDSIGLALGFYNVFKVKGFLERGIYKIEVLGEGAGEAEKPEENGFVLAYEATCRRWGIAPPGLDLLSLNAIPFCRGLGSSSSAIVGGVMVANELRDEPLSKEELLPLMVELEGHPDNVVPCCLGGFVVSCWLDGDLRYVRLPCGEEEMTAVVAVPDVRVPTSQARAALPKYVPMEDAVFNLGRSALLAASWATGKWENLSWAVGDRIHQPFRSKLFPGGEKILETLREIPGCDGVAISGSGPTMVAFTRWSPEKLARPMCRIFAEAGVHSRFFVLDVDRYGASVETTSDFKTL